VSPRRRLMRRPDPAPDEPGGHGVTIRGMRPRDVPQIVDIEEQTSATPWPRHMLLAELGRPGTLDIAAVEGADVVGYVLASRYADVWHILNVAVRPDRRRRGIGAAMLRHLFHETARTPHLGHTLEVRVSNAGAIALYEGLGFVSHGVRTGYYSDNGEDALVMWRAEEGAAAGDPG
jgi:[ribosomal protein S18]-alanine N-acetyltransferase